MDRMKAVHQAISKFNNDIMDCVECPFYDDYCSGDGDKRCLIEELAYLLEICLREGVTLDD